MYFRQAMNGLYVRMALLTMLLDKETAAGVRGGREKDEPL